MPLRRVKRRSYSYKSTYRKRSKKFHNFKRLVRILSFSLTGLVLFSITFYFYTLTQNLRKPFAQASNGVDYNTKTYDSTDPFNLLFVKLENKDKEDTLIKSMYIYHIDPVQNAYTLFELPVDITVTTPIQKVEIEIFNLYKLGNLNSKEEGIAKILEFIKNYLAIDLDGYIIYDEESEKVIKELGIDIKKNNLASSINYSYFLKISELFNYSRKNLLSDLNSVEALKIISDTKNINVNQKFVKITNDEIKNIDLFDSLWQENTSYTDINKERLSVTVLNSTSVAGVAGWGARYVKNTKGIILEVGNYPELQYKNTVYSLVNDSKLLNKLNNFFEVDQVLLPEDFKVDPFLAERSDIILVLGEKSIY